MLGLGACDADPGCPEDLLAADQECTTSLDCADANRAGLSCVDGRCRLTCLRDEDCRATATGDDECGLRADQTAVCEGQVCVAGCPDRPCSDGQSECAAGRCAYAFEGFEATGDVAPTLETLGWNDLGRELENPKSFVVFEGADGCAPGPSCGGVAAEGRRFVRLGTQPTPEKGTATTEPSCRACACCLECRLDPPLQAPSILECPREATFPPRLLCGPAQRCDEPPPSEEVPEVCRAPCEACEGCPASGRQGDLLSACEAQAAARTCPACSACDDVFDACRTCREEHCSEACTDRLSAECEACEIAEGCDCGPCRDCAACDDARDCRESGGASERCAALEDRCDALGAAGCFSVPVDYPRAQLTPGEQALESFPIDLDSAPGPVVLELSYVAFNVGDEYLVGEQGVSVCSWETRPQEVVIELCRGGCADESSWIEARFTDGRRAAFPPLSQRGNGLPFGSQSAVDWRSGRLRVDVPAELFGPETRFRFVPRLSENASVGIDDVIVRSAR